MPRGVESFVIAKHAADAARILAREGGRAALLAGGSALALHVPGGVQTIVDIMRCGLEGVKADGKRLRIGATTVAGTLAAAIELDAFGAVPLREAAAAISAQAVRNQVTLGGNLVGTLSWSDMPVALLAIGGQVRTVRASGAKRTLSVAELLAAHPRKVLARDEIITEIELKKPRGKVGGAFVKMARTVSDLALATSAVVLRVEGGLCRDVRIAVGSVQPRPARALKAEKALDGAPGDEGLFAHAAELAADAATVHADLRASKEHRRVLLVAAVKRALRLAFARASGNETYAPIRRPAPPPWRRELPPGEPGHLLRVTIDGTPRVLAIQPADNLLEVLRRNGFTSVKRGCADGYCGTCAIQVDGRLLNSCLLLAAQVDGCELKTVQSLGTVFNPHPLQTAFVETGAVQCGFCTPGFIIASDALLSQIPDPTDAELRAALDGNLCRCTGYVKQLEAVKLAAARLRSRA